MKKLAIGFLLTLVLIVCTACGGATPTKIEVTTTPTKIDYTVGERFTAQGGKLTVTSSDSSTLVIDLTDAMCGTVSTAVAGDVTVPVIYENLNTSFKIIVRAVATVATVEELLNAIKNAREGDTIIIAGGVYVTDLVINKAINLVGAGENETRKTIIAGSLTNNGRAEIRDVTVASAIAATNAELLSTVANAIEGDTIFVAGGVYVTDLVINKAINLVGAGVDKTKIEGFITVNGNATIQGIEILIQNGATRTKAVNVGSDVKNFSLIDSLITTNTPAKDLGYASGIASTGTSALTINVDGSEIIGFAYAIETVSDEQYTANIKNSKLTGYGALRIYSSATVINITHESVLVGRNLYAMGSSGYATIVVEEKGGDEERNTGNTVNLSNSTLKNQFGGNDNQAYQYLVDFRTNNNTLNVDKGSSLIDTRVVTDLTNVTDTKMFLMLWGGAYTPVGNVFSIDDECTVESGFPLTGIEPGKGGNKIGSMEIGRENSDEISISYTHAYKFTVTTAGVYNFHSTAGTDGSTDPDFFIAKGNGLNIVASNADMDADNENYQFDKNVELAVGEYIIFIVNWGSVAKVNVNINLVPTQV